MERAIASTLEWPILLRLSWVISVETVSISIAGVGTDSDFETSFNWQDRMGRHEPEGGGAWLDSLWTKKRGDHQPLIDHS